MIGTRLGQYRIDALLGQGGMGAVYLATDEMLGRQVAIKVLRDDGGDGGHRNGALPQARRRFSRGSITRTSCGCTGSRRIRASSTWSPSSSRARRSSGDSNAARRSRPTQVLEWAGQVLDALDYAHQLGVVHRDIKPANILIDERNRARLLDFGIARIVGTEGPTQTGHAVGTLTYMAPEQVLDEPIDGRVGLVRVRRASCARCSTGRRPIAARPPPP